MIAVWPSSRVPGGSDDVMAGTLEEACERLPYDAHATGYLLPGGEEAQTRVRLDMVGGLVARGRTPMQHWVFVDFDTPDHSPLDPEEAAILAELARAVATDTFGARPATYTTRAGLRLVFELAQPIDVRQVDPYLQHIHATLDKVWREVHPEQEVAVDMVTPQWTRAYRLPKVNRDGVDLPSFVDLKRTPLALDFDLPPAEEYDAAKKLAALDLVEVERGDWWHHVRPSHKAYRYREAIAEGRELVAPPGEWHAMLVGLVGSLVSVLQRTAKAPEELAGKVYAILAPSVLAGAVDAADLDQLEDLCTRFAPRDWPEDDVDKGTEDLDTSTRPDHLVVGHPTSSVCWAWLGDAWAGPFSGGAAGCRLARAYPDLEFASKAGNPYPLHKLVNLYGIVADTITYSAFHEGFDGSNLTVKLYPTRGNITPRQHPEVEAWLELVEGNGGPVREWLMWLGDLSVPLPAMLWRGKKSVGKAMMAEAISSYFGTPQKTEWRRLTTDNFGSAGLLESPLVWADEFGGFNTEAESEVWRELTANTTHTVRRMRTEPLTITTCLRVFGGTNEPGAVTIKGRASQDALRAVRDRFVGIDVPSSAADYLEQGGGRGGITKEWVHKTDGSPGKLVEHIAWLQTQRPAAFTGRYAVDPYLAPALRRGAITGNSEEILVWLACGNALLRGHPACVVREEGFVHVNPSALSASWGLWQVGEKANVTSIAAVVKRFSTGQDRIEGRRYHRIPGEYVTTALEDVGHEHTDRVSEGIADANVVQLDKRSSLGGG